jgi:GDP-D-mannose dehydratase
MTKLQKVALITGITGQDGSYLAIDPAGRVTEVQEKKQFLSLQLSVFTTSSEQMSLLTALFK